MTLIMMNNAEAGPSRPKALWDPVPRVNAMYDFDFIEVPSSPEVDVEHAFDTPVATTATTVEEAQSTQSSSSSFRGPAKRKKRSNVEVVIPLRRKKIRRILSPTPESDTTASPTPPARPRPSVPRARLIPPIPPPLPAPEVSLPPYLLSADPVQPSIHYTRPTTGPLGLGPAPLPPRAPGPRCTAQSWALVKLGISADRHPEAVFIPNGTDTPSDIWSSSSIFRVSHLKYEPADVALRAWLLGKGPRVDSDQVKGKGKGGKVKDKGKMVSVELAKVDTPVLAAAEASAARKEEEERNGRSASQALDIAESDDGNEVEVEVEIPHSQTMPIEHPPTPARGSPTPTTDLAGDVDDDDYRPKQEVAPMQLLTGDQRFRIGKPIVAWPAHVLAKKARIVKAAEAKVKAEAEAAAAAQAAQAPLQPEGIFPEGSTSKLDNGDEIKPHDKDSEPDIITRVTRSMLAPPPPPADAQDAQEAVRSAALRVAYREHGRTIGADVWHTIMECEAKEEEWAREEKAAEEPKAEV